MESKQEIKPDLFGAICHLKKTFGKTIRKALFDTSEQAETMVKSLDGYLNQSEKEIITAFGKIHKSNYFTRKFIYLKYSFFKIGTLRCIAQFLVG
ncbi:MAG: hypothetical protein UHG68_10065 [Clostridia bacterium]|nr:hypothetical protein [Clostridia bacterium]